MIDYRLKTKEIFELLVDYITSKSKYCKKVSQSKILREYPCVIFSELTNEKYSSSIDKRQNIRNLSFQIDIYATNINNISSLEISDEIEQLVIEIMENYFGLNGGRNARIEDINSQKATQTTLRYNCKWWIERNQII